MSKSLAVDFLESFEELKIPDELATDYTVMERLSVNDIGETYLLTEQSSNKNYVMKCYHKSQMASGNNEAELLNGLDYKGLPKLKTKIENDNTLFVIREYVEGVTLNHYISEQGVMTVTMTLCAAMELCDILTYLHNQSSPIIHRDIKPSNIIINATDSSITLIDFGISRKYSKTADSDTLNFGTKKFSPPEQYGFAQTDSRSDLYSLGVVIRFMLTGSADGQVEDEGLKKIIEKCTDFSPKDRYANAEVLKKALLKCKKSTRNKAMRSSISALVVCAALSVGFFLGRYTEILHFSNAEPIFNEPSPSHSNEPLTTSATQTSDDVMVTSEPSNAPAINEPDKPVLFSEPLIEKAVRHILGKDDKAQLWQSEMQYVTALFIYDDEVYRSDEEFNTADSGLNFGRESTGTIVGISDFKNLPHLKKINFNGQPLSDISVLSELAELEYVTFFRCKIKDISPLNSLPNLIGIHLFDNPVADISTLTNMPSLKELNLQDTNITSLDGIENLTSLIRLRITNTNVTDFSLINNMPSLKELQISPDMVQYLGTINREDLKIDIDN